MATCIHFEVSEAGAGRAVSASGQTLLPWAVGDATYSGGQYACASGSHMVMTVQEVNALPKTGVPDAELMRETFFMSFGLVIGVWFVGKCVGAVLRLIKGDESEFS